MRPKIWRGAERELKRALELNPTFCLPTRCWDNSTFRRGAFADARREFEALSKRHAKPVSALTMLGIIAQMEGDNAQALEHFQRAVDLDPRAAIAANNLAWIYAERGEKLDYALQLAQTAVQVMPKAPKRTTRWGGSITSASRPSQPSQAFRQTVALAADNPTYHYHLGLAYLLAEDPDHARQSIERALDLGGRKAPWAAKPSST